jgi:hypothetical protein
MHTKYRLCMLYKNAYETGHKDSLQVWLWTVWTVQS